MFVSRAENSQDITSDTFGRQPDQSERKWLRTVRSFAILICFTHFLVLAYLARQHPFGTYATETDFYQLFAPDAERILSGKFPQNTFQGPGYPAAIVLIAKLTGSTGDLFTAGKWFSVICAVSCGWLIFILFSRLFNPLAGVGAQLIAVASGEFPQYSIQAATDVFFLLLCLAAMTVFLGEKFTVRWRATVSGVLAGAAYLTRYNGLFLVATFLIGILVFDHYRQRLGERIVTGGLFLAFFLLAASPWLILNWSH